MFIIPFLKKFLEFLGTITTLWTGERLEMSCARDLMSKNPKFRYYSY